MVEDPDAGTAVEIDGGTIEGAPVVPGLETGVVMLGADRNKACSSSTLNWKVSTASSVEWDSKTISSYTTHKETFQIRMRVTA